MRTAAIALAIVIGVLGGFYGGLRYGETRPVAAKTATAGQGVRGNGSGFQGGTFTGGQAPCPTPGSAGRGAATGTIRAAGNGTLTIHDSRCNVDVKVSYGSSAMVTRVTQGQAGDLKTGENVTVIGQRAADGSISATAISITPARGQ